MVSLEKEKKEGTSTTLLTGTLSKSVNTVNKLLQNKIFNSELQRIRKDQNRDLLLISAMSFFLGYRTEIINHV